MIALFEEYARDLDEKTGKKYRLLEPTQAKAFFDRFDPNVTVDQVKVKLNSLIISLKDKSEPAEES